MRKIILDTNAYTKLLAGDETILNVIGESDLVLKVPEGRPVCSNLSRMNLHSSLLYPQHSC